MCGRPLPLLRAAVDSLDGIACGCPIASIRSALSSPIPPVACSSATAAAASIAMIAPSDHAAGCRAPGSAAGSHSRAAIAPCGARATPSCSSSTSRPRSRPAIGRASSAGATRRRHSRRRSRAAAVLAPLRERPRWTGCCTPSAWRAGASGGTASRSTICPTAPFSPSRRSRSACSRCAELRCCAGRRQVTSRRARGRVGSLPMS